MLVYIGQTRTRAFNALFNRLGIRAMHFSGRMDRPRVANWALDNGAFVRWRKGMEWDPSVFEKDLSSLSDLPSPDFVILPDLVAQGRASLAMSMEWFDRHPRPDWYLAVQDGMTPWDIPWACGLKGIFVGGTPEWKWESLPMWVRFAHRHGMPVHVGRISTPRKLIQARAMGADSGDSNQPLWTKDDMMRYLTAAFQETLWRGDFEGYGDDDPQPPQGEGNAQQGEGRE